MFDNDIILIQEINRLKANPNFDTPKRIESLMSRLESHPLWRYHKNGEIDQFSYVEWNDEDSTGYEVTMFLSLLVKTQSNCNGFCGEYECKENKEGCKRNDN